MIRAIAHLGEEKIVHVFLAEWDALKQQSGCGVCGMLSLASEQVGEKVMDLAVTQLLSVSESTVSRGTPTTHGMALYKTCNGVNLLYVQILCSRVAVY
jgi:hypothetical protein